MAGCLLSTAQFANITDVGVMFF